MELSLEGVSILLECCKMRCLELGLRTPLTGRLGSAGGLGAFTLSASDGVLGFCTNKKMPEYGGCF